jgi:3-oxoacyl-[acyl-carrier-protein] synthase-3
MTPAVCQPLIPLQLIATGKALPKECVTSAELDRRLGHQAGFVERRSGVVRRYYASAKASQSALGAEALRDALTRGAIAPDSIDLLISACGVPEQALPNTAAHILKHAGLADGTPGFDVGASCLSFLAAMQTAAGLLHTGAYRRIAIVASDLASRGIDWAQPEASLIFGDGAAAAIVEAGRGEAGIVACRFETYPAGRAFCEIRAGGTRRNPRVGADASDFLFHMDGKRIFRLASGLIEGFLQRLLGQNGLAIGDIDTVVPHQASHLAMTHIRQRLGVPAASVIDIYAGHGNQVAASLPTALHEAVSTGRATPGRQMLLLGSGAGLMLGGMVLRT